MSSTAPIDTISLEQYRAMVTKSRNKFHAVPVATDDGVFQSSGEYRCYQNLLLEQAAGLIQELKHHVTKIMIAPGFKRGRRTYKARVFTPDYTYLRMGMFTVHDFKSDATMTADFSLRWHIAQLLHPDWNFVITTKRDL